MGNWPWALFWGAQNSHPPFWAPGHCPWAGPRCPITTYLCTYAPYAVGSGTGLFAIDGQLYTLANLMIRTVTGNGVSSRAETNPSTIRTATLSPSKAACKNNDYALKIHWLVFGTTKVSLESNPI